MKTILTSSAFPKAELFYYREKIGIFRFSGRSFLAMNYFFGCLLLLLLWGCQPPPSSPVTGLWQLHIMEQQDSTGQWTEYRNGLKGYLLYDGHGHMTLTLCPQDYEQTNLTFKNFTDTLALEKLQYLTGYYSYMGRYQILEEEGIVEHTRITHTNPNEWNQTVHRRFSFAGDTLIVAPVEAKNADLRLKWLKVE